MKEIKGDLIALAKQGEFDVIVHGCNCFCTMGSGIAAQVRRYFPVAYNADRLTVAGDKSKLGKYSCAVTSVFDEWGLINQLTIINAYTQYAFGSDKVHVDYEAIAKILHSLNMHFAGSDLKFGIPFIGAGLAGGDWVRIKKIIEENTRHIDLTVVEYVPDEDFWEAYNED